MTGESTTVETRDSAREDTGAREGPEASEATGERGASEETSEQRKPDGTDERGVTRRGFVRRAAGAATAAGAASVAAADTGAAQAETYRFGGEVAAWRGREPSAIEGTDNPTIELEAGTEYEFWFENIDGAPHNITIQDADGGTIAQSELIDSEGGTASVTFTATPQMAQYICTIHPTTMVGDLEVTGELEGGGGGISMRTLLVAAAVVLAFVSPLLFAVFLFSQGGGSGGETTTRT